MPIKTAKPRSVRPRAAAVASASVPRYVVLDVEIIRRVQDVGGWRDPANVRRTGLAVGVVFTSWTGQISIFLEGQVRALAKVLREVPLVVGYNLDRFDLEVLRGYPGVALKNVSTFDLMNVVQMEAERRISLDALAQANFDIAPWSGSKLIERWKRGDSRAVIEACVNHALIIDRLFRKVLNDGELSVPNGPGKTECISIRAPTFAEKAS